MTASSDLHQDDKSVPAHSAIARCDLPAIHVPGGRSSTPNYSTSDLLWGMGAAVESATSCPMPNWKSTRKGLPHLGRLPVHGRRQRQQVLSEALGLALPGSA